MGVVESWSTLRGLCISTSLIVLHHVTSCLDLTTTRWAHANVSMALSQLNLWSNPIGGKLPAMDWLPHGLSTLNLSQAQLGGTIPGRTPLPESLLVLDWSNNSLTGTIPSEWGRSMPSGLQDLWWVDGWLGGLQDVGPALA